VFGGSATYARGLLQALGRVGELEYMVFTPTLAPEAGGGLPGRTVGAYRTSSSTAGRLLAMGLATVRPGPIRAALEPSRLEALHYPLTIMVPSVPGPPAVTTVHDVLHLVHPEFFSRSERAYRRVMYRRITGAHVVISPSEYGRDVLVERLGLASERVRVIHHGVDHQTFWPGGGPREPFFVYPADGYPHKNHRRLLEAFARVRRERTDLRLLLVGRDLDPAWARGDVEVRPRASADELAGLYRTASGLVFPSRDEIFGLPPLEAMACGCPVAVADAGALREVGGESALYFDPQSVEDMAAAMLALPELAPRGVEHAAMFTWERCARAHDEVYRELASLDSTP
jgi:glycosyltransferase involved in cell wall biosynthesis